MGLIDFLEGQGYRNIEKRTLIAAIILGIAIVILIIYFLFFYTKPCLDAECFVSSMSKCKKVSWIKEDQKSTWTYTILGNSQDSKCEVEVKLIKIKQGPIENEKLEGKSMVCQMQKGETRFPEENILSCSGLLKEEMQEIIIQNMHNYLLENIGEIKEEFKSI